MTFNDLSLIAPLQKAITHVGYNTPTPIQSQCIPSILEGRDVLGCAQTGTGKTAAFAIPIIQLLEEKNESRQGKKPIKSLILTPTRELAIQISENINEYGKYTNLKHLVIYGGVPQTKQVNSLRNGIDILVATPGRLLDLMNQGFIKLNQVEIFTLDEADRMLDMGFVHDVKKVIAKLPVKRQTLFFSATMPHSITKLSNSILSNPKRVDVSPATTTAETVKQQVYAIDKNNKKKLLIDLLSSSKADRVLVFTRTKHGANKVVKDLVKKGIKSEAIHGNKTQNSRQRALKNFKAKTTRVLVATDIAARGIDIEELELVINFEIPNIAETYVHRIGRTGRAGNSGKAISFCNYEEKAYLKDIQKLTGNKIPEITDHPYPMMDFEIPEKTPNRGRSSGRGQASKKENNKRNNRRRGSF